jgi:hypothetical protein
VNWRGYVAQRSSARHALGMFSGARVGHTPRDVLLEIGVTSVEWWRLGQRSAGALVLLSGVAGAAFPGVNGPIVFQSTRSATASGCLYGSTSELFVKLTVSPFSVPQLDCTGSTDQHPFVSPDGSEVIFASNRNDGVDFQLYTMPLSTDGTASGTPVDVSQNLPSGASDDYPSWAPAAPGGTEPDHLPEHPGRWPARALHRGREHPGIGDPGVLSVPDPDVERHRAGLRPVEPQRDRLRADPGEWQEPDLHVQLRHPGADRTCRPRTGTRTRTTPSPTSLPPSTAAGYR